MERLVIQWLITATLVVCIFEIGKRNTVLAALVASLPLTSLLSLLWLYYDTGESERIVAFSHSILVYLLPSVVFFLVLPWLLRWGLHFYVSLVASAVVTGLAYAVTDRIVKNFFGREV